MYVTVEADSKSRAHNSDVVMTYSLSRPGLDDAVELSLDSCCINCLVPNMLLTAIKTFQGVF